MDPTIDTELDPGDAGHTLSDDVVNTVPGDLDPVDIEIDDLIGSALREAQAARGGRRGQGARRPPPRLTTLMPN